MEKMNGESMNIEREKIERLKEIFPEVFTEDKIDFEKLQLILGEDIEGSEKRYSFNWHGKKDAIRLSQTPTTGTLRPDKDNSKNWDETENLYIEGDNLEVLKLLQKSYHGKIKMIYIDPPYNTGKDFIYKDNYRDNMKNYLEFTEQVDEEGHKLSTNTDTSGRYHTDWLNMMYPRLRLARNLLTDDGVIFISIDDNEVHNLRKICDEIFGEENFVAQILREAIRGGSLSKNIRNVHDYVICYAKNIENVNFGGIETEGIDLNLRDKHGKYAKGRELNKWGAGSRREDSPSMFYPIPGPNGQDVYPIRNDGSEGRWRLGKEKMKKLLKADNVIFEPRGDGTYIVYEKLRNDAPRIKQFTTWFTQDYINAKGTEELKLLFQKERAIFNFAKPSKLVYDLAIMANDKNSIILDFFSGSSTTAQAVMDLNAEDGGNRKFIMVQLPEPTDEKSEAYKEGYKTIVDIGRERIRRAGEKILEDNKDKEGIGDLDIGFKSFKLDSSNIKEWNPEYMEKDFTMEELVNNFIPDREKEDILYEIILKYGIDLTAPIEEHEVEDKTIFNIGFGSLFICLEDNIDEKIVKEILKLNEEYKMPNPIAVFKDIGFKNDEIKLNAKLSLNDNGIEEVVSI